MSEPQDMPAMAAMATTPVTMSNRAEDAERELDASAAILATARRRIAQLEAENVDLRRALTENIQAGIADKVLAELGRHVEPPALRAPADVAAAPPRDTYAARAASDVPICGCPNTTPTDPPTFCTLPPGHRHGCWCKTADARSYTWTKLGSPP